jgi:epoxyqueuosine reductase QueG
MPQCESVVVFGRPYVVHPFEVDEKTHVANESWWEANQVVYDQIAAWKGKLVGLFDNFGLGSASFGGFWLAEPPTFSYRLAQVEAGIGVYGRIGVCLNPEYGCYYHVGVLLVEAMLPPTERQYADGFSPCTGCGECAKVRPVKAIDMSLEPGAGYDRELCARFILKVNEKRGREDKLCARCFGACPWSMGKLGGARAEVG